MVDIRGPMAMTPEEEAADGSLFGRALRGFGRGVSNLVNNERAMSGLSGMAQGLLQAGAVSQRPISNAEAMAMASQGASQRLGQYDQQRTQDEMLEMKKRQLEQSGRPDIGSYNPRDYTTDSFSRFVQTGDPSVLKRYEGARTVMVAGVPHVFDPSSGKLVPVSTAENVGRDKATIEGMTAEGKESAKGGAKTRRGLIDDGLDAVGQIPTLTRTLDLLNEVETGGIQSRAALALKQQFGIEGADEGELSANLGKAVLGQLRSTFGAQFTEREGERLERIEAGFGKSTETNKRLIRSALDSVIRTARRGLRAAERDGDEFAAEEIRNAITALEGQRDAVSDSGAQPQGAAPQTGEIRFLGFE